MTIDESYPTEQQTGGRRRLVLMRHAKSDWGGESVPDHDRPLNKRGRKSAPVMARWLADVDSVPDLVLSSSSERTRETMDLMLPEWSDPPDVVFDEELYLAPAESILATIRSKGQNARTLLILAHNPGMAHLVSCLAEKYVDMPTAAAAVFDAKVDDWQTAIDPDCVTFVEYMRPKALR